MHKMMQRANQDFARMNQNAQQIQRDAHRRAQRIIEDQRQQQRRQIAESARRNAQILQGAEAARRLRLAPSERHGSGIPGGASLSDNSIAPGTANRSPRSVELHVVSGPAKGAVLKIDSNRHLLGRNSPSPWNLAGDGSVSRVHAALTVDETGSLAIEDLDSTFGTSINGEGISNVAKVNEGDRLTIGQTTIQVVKPSGSSGTDAKGSDAMSREPIYQTPFAADLERGARRFLRFYFKMALIALAVGVVVAGFVAVVADQYGNRSVTVPSLVGLGSVAAAQTLSQAGLVDEQLSESSSSVPFGQIVLTSPSAGARVKAGSEVQVEVSCGSPAPGTC